MSENPADQDGEAPARDVLLVATVGASLLNGMHFSPLFEPALVLLRPVLGSFFITSQLVSFYVTSIFLGLATLMLAGVPAALFERVTGRERSDTVSLGIWLGATLLLVLPAFLAMYGG